MAIRNVDGVGELADGTRRPWDRGVNRNNLAGRHIEGSEEDHRGLSDVPWAEPHVPTPPEWLPHCDQRPPPEEIQEAAIRVGVSATVVTAQIVTASAGVVVTAATQPPSAQSVTVGVCVGVAHAERTAVFVTASAGVVVSARDVAESAAVAVGAESTMTFAYHETVAAGVVVDVDVSVNKVKTECCPEPISRELYILFWAAQGIYRPLLHRWVPIPYSQDEGAWINFHWFVDGEQPFDWDTAIWVCELGAWELRIDGREGWEGPPSFVGCAQEVFFGSWPPEGGGVDWMIRSRPPDTPAPLTCGVLVGVEATAIWGSAVEASAGVLIAADVDAAVGVAATAGAGVAVGVSATVAIGHRFTVTAGVLAGSSFTWSFEMNPIGTIIWYGGTDTPSGYLLCDGNVLNQVTNAALFAVIGTTFNTGGEAAGTFRKPDLQGRCPIGTGSGSGLTGRALAARGGAETHALTGGEMPAHTHAPTTGKLLTYTNGGSGTFKSTGGTEQLNLTTIANAGGGAAHNNMPPFLALRAFIKAV